MPTERVRRQVERHLHAIEAAVEVSDWARVRRLTRNVLTMEPGHADAEAYLEAAERALSQDNGAVPLKRQSRRWTADEEAELRRMARKMPVRLIARQLDRTPDSVRHRAYSLGLSLRYDGEPLLP